MEKMDFDTYVYRRLEAMEQDKQKANETLIRTITTKCPCGYVHKVEEHVEIRTISANVITCKPGRGPVVHDKPQKKEFVIESKVIEGDAEFETDNEFIACPKCGTVLLPKIARKIKEKKLK